MKYRILENELGWFKVQEKLSFYPFWLDVIRLKTKNFGRYDCTEPILFPTKQDAESYVKNRIYSDDQKEKGSRFRVVG